MFIAINQFERETRENWAHRRKSFGPICIWMYKYVFGSIKPPRAGRVIWMKILSDDKTAHGLNAYLCADAEYFARTRRREGRARHRHDRDK